MWYVTQDKTAQRTKQGHGLTGEGLGGANHGLVSEGLEHALDGTKLLHVTNGGGGSVGVDVVDVALAVLGLVCAMSRSTHESAL
jgi:hypothetical protein